MPPRKAPGPDGIPNEVLKALGPDIAAGIAHGINKLVADYNPESILDYSLQPGLKESTTVVLRKEGRSDYTQPGSYRPIALENTIAKVMEKVLADRLSKAAEDHDLLPWTQMGARKNRSTMSAVGLLTSCVQSAWQAKPGSVVSMLSLDLSGAFDNVTQASLDHALARKGIPMWMRQRVACFQRERRTRISYPGHLSQEIHTHGGIPQGSPLSPILFLFYISELLERFTEPAKGILGIGFVDDTNLITWGKSAGENCRKLTEAHKACTEWAGRNNARFNPEKYQLIHFTKRRHHNTADLASTISIENTEIKLERKAIRVLGAWLDPALTWREHLAVATRKGLNASEALSRLTASTWGPAGRHSRILYTATVRPALLYGVQEWSFKTNGEKHGKSMLKPLEKVQRECLRRVTGAYRRTPTALLEREANVPPLGLYIEKRRHQARAATRDHRVERQIKWAADAVWHSLRRRRAGQTQARPQTGREKTLKQATQAAQDGSKSIADRQHATSTRKARPAKTPTESQAVEQWAREQWAAQWQRQRDRFRDAQRGTAWNTPWTQEPSKLYAGLPKAEATALFLARTEVIGLNAWLAAIHVPGVLPTCPCGWHAQTVRHVLLHCPRHPRGELLRKCRTESLQELLTEPANAGHVARWLVRTGALPQFRVTNEMADENVAAYCQFEEAEKW